MGRCGNALTSSGLDYQSISDLEKIRKESLYLKENCLARKRGWGEGEQPEEFRRAEKGLKVAARKHLVHSAAVQDLPGRGRKKLAKESERKE